MPNDRRTVTINALGHPNIRATHRSTVEVTKEKHLSEAGDCVIAVSADKGLKDLDREFLDLLRSDSATIAVQFQTDGIVDAVHALGGSRLILTHPHDMVVRKSDYVSERTLAVKADKAAIDLSRDLVTRLKNPMQKVQITLTVTV